MIGSCLCLKLRTPYYSLKACLLIQSQGLGFSRAIWEFHLPVILYRRQPGSGVDWLGEPHMGSQGKFQLLPRGKRCDGLGRLEFVSFQFKFMLA